MLTYDNEDFYGYKHEIIKELKRWETDKTLLHLTLKHIKTHLKPHTLYKGTYDLMGSYIFEEVK